MSAPLLVASLLTGPGGFGAGVSAMAWSGVWSAAHAEVGARVVGVVLAQAKSLDQVFTNVRTLIMAALGGLTLALLSIAGLRYLGAGGDPVQVEKAKSALRAAAIGFGLVVLAPLVLALLKQVVGM